MIALSFGCLDGNVGTGSRIIIRTVFLLDGFSGLLTIRTMEFGTITTT